MRRPLRRFDRHRLWFWRVAPPSARRQPCSIGSECERLRRHRGGQRRPTGLNWRAYMSSKSEIAARLERVKGLWLELEQVQPTTPRYEALMKEIRTESAACLAVVRHNSFRI